MNISESSKDRVRSIRWLHNAGASYVSTGIVMVQAGEASRIISEPEWEDVTLQASNEISGFLAKKHSVIFQEWNNLAKQAKDFFEKEVVGNIPSMAGFDNAVILQCVRWDVMHFLIEDAYSKMIPGRHFFERLIEIYENGNLPCGWRGSGWPNGDFLVF